MHYAPSIQLDNTPCKSSLKYSRFIRNQGCDILVATLQCRSDLIDTDCSIVKLHLSRMSNIYKKKQTFLEITTCIKFGAP